MQDRPVITDVVITTPNLNPVSCQRIFRENSPATSRIAVPARSSFSHTFATGIVFTEDQIVRVRNGNSPGPTHFYLRGFLTTP